MQEATRRVRGYLHAAISGNHTRCCGCQQWRRLPILTPCCWRAICATCLNHAEEQRLEDAQAPLRCPACQQQVRCLEFEPHVHVCIIYVGGFGESAVTLIERVHGVSALDAYYLYQVDPALLQQCQPGFEIKTPAGGGRVVKSSKIDYLIKLITVSMLAHTGPVLSIVTAIVHDRLM